MTKLLNGIKELYERLVGTLIIVVCVPILLVIIVAVILLTSLLALITLLFKGTESFGDFLEDCNLILDKIIGE